MRAHGMITRSVRRLVTPSSSPAPFLCHKCASRYFSSPAVKPEAVLSPPPPEPPAAGYTALGSRRLVSVSGPDAAKYLQGVITANILTPERTPRVGGFYTAFLNAQGRVLHDVFIYPDTLTSSGSAAVGDSFLIEVDAAEAEQLARHIKRYKLRAKFDVRALAPDEATVWHAWDDLGRRLGATGESLPDSISHGSLNIITGAQLPALRDTRSPEHGSRIISLGGADELPVHVAPWLEANGAVRTPETSYRVRRYLHGVAEGQSEILREKALPPESNLDLAGAIDWHKGCYVGQELTIRTRHRGVVRKRILPCMLYGEDDPSAPGQLEYITQEEQQSPSPPLQDDSVAADGSRPTTSNFAAELIPPETSIGRVGKRGRSAGKWLSGIGNVGLALCRLEIMTDISVPGEAAATAAAATTAARDDPGNEFVIVTDLDENGGSGQAVKVKAFVPDWLRDGLAAEAASQLR